MIELLYFTGCPNHETFLPHLRELLRDLGEHRPVQLIHVTDDRSAQQHRFLGSPTLRIDGYDVESDADQRTNYGMQCRIYPTPTGPAGAPPDAWIISALSGTESPGTH